MTDFFLIASGTSDTHVAVDRRARHGGDEEGGLAGHITSKDSSRAAGCCSTSSISSCTSSTRRCATSTSSSGCGPTPKQVPLDERSRRGCMTRVRRGRAAIRRQPRARSSPEARRARAQNYFGQNQVQYDRFKWQITRDRTLPHLLLPRGSAPPRSTRRAWPSAPTPASRACSTTSSARRSRSCSSRRAPTSGRTTSPAISAKAPAASPKRCATACCSTSPATTRSFEHVLTHEMVHAFQYDIFARGKAGNGLQTLAQYLPPLWFAEGMAEYLSLGPNVARRRRRGCATRR